MNFLKNLQKLVVGEFFEDQVIKEQYNGFEDSSQPKTSSSFLECCGNFKYFLNYNNQSSTNNANLQPKKYILNNLQIQEDKLLSEAHISIIKYKLEGGYGYVWKAHNANNKQEIFAIKRMICQYKLPKHDNLVGFIDGDILKEDENTSQAVYVMEFCPDGTLFNLMESRQKSGGFSEQEIIHITLQICKGLQVLHSMNITHRDLKIENVLLKDGMFKLCDFGSASTDIIDLKQIIYQFLFNVKHIKNFQSTSKLDRKQQSEQEELFERYTTLQSRPPEMCDIFSGEMVDSRVDIWMLGCLVYCLCFYIHPFYEASKLAIISASYKFKQNSKYNEKMHDFIRHLLTPSPKFRPKIEEVIKILENWDNLQEIPLNEQAKQTKLQEQQFEQDMKERDQKVKQMIEKNRQQRLEEEQRKKLEAEANSAFKLFSQNTSTQKMSKDMKEIDEFDNWGDFQKADQDSQDNTKQIQNNQGASLLDGEIDFNSFQPSNQVQSIDNNNFDFGQFYDKQS